MLKLRLKRVGRKHDPSFRIVVVENTKSPKGGYLESVGFYNAILKQLQIKKDRASYWLGVGAQPTDVVHNLLVREGVVNAPKIAVHKKAKKKQEQSDSQPTAGQEQNADAQPQQEKKSDDQQEQPQATDKQEEQKNEQEQEKQEPAKEKPQAIDKEEQEQPQEQSKDKKS